MKSRKEVVPGKVLFESLSGLNLCRDCARRQGLASRYPSKNFVHAANCELCHGVLSDLDALAGEICDRLKYYEFDHFVVGATLPQSIPDREDEIRSELKIRGREGLKTQLTRSIGDIITERTGKPVKYRKPDVTVLVSIKDNSTQIVPRSIWVSARYRKNKRGIPQRSRICKTCNGIGCSNCNYKGIETESVQTMTSVFFRKLFGADGCNFIWIGSEDQQSLVQGFGRPFFAEIIRPRLRHIPKEGVKQLEEGIANQDSLIISSVELIQAKPWRIPSFSMRCRIYLRSDKEKLDHTVKVQELESRFNRSVIEVRLSRKPRVVKKRINWIKIVERQDSGLVLEMEGDGGIPIKKLITGGDDSVKPNLSNYLEGFKIDPEKVFDVLEVTLRTDKSDSSMNMGSNEGTLSRNAKERYSRISATERT